MGILFGLGILWLVGELIHRHKEEDQKAHLTLASALKRIDMNSIVFFSSEYCWRWPPWNIPTFLEMLAKWLDANIGRQGRDCSHSLACSSAVVDNVPLVAASMACTTWAQISS